MTGTIPDEFRAQVARHPDLPAVLADDAALSYRELGSAVGATARSIGAGGPVALLCTHGATTVTGLLAALVAGRPYLPLDPTFPEARLAELLADSEADLLLTDPAHEALAERVSPAGVRIVHIGQPTGEDLDAVLAGLETTAQPDDPAYLLYTSGSTGTPKGVVQSHRNVLFGIANHRRNFGITPADRTSVLTSFSYDMAVTDLFGAILSGAAAVPVDIRARGLGHLADTLARHGVTIYHSTPTVYRYLVASLGERRLLRVRAVLLGGEEVTRHDVELARRHFSPEVVFVNGYGTTEISFVAQNHLPPDVPLDHAVVPIGAPLDGIEVVLLDGDGRPAETTGEILVVCQHVAVGYWRRPELTASRFVSYQGVRAYRTGDLGTWLPDGRLVFLGRTDRLVKIRGYRVELGEVEARLAALPGVAHAAVVARTLPGGEKEIIGYVVGTVDPARLRAELAVSLPDFMVPRAVVAVDALPMGMTGKLDTTALPPPPEPSTTDVVEGAELEQTIAGAWCEVLGLSGVDWYTSFTELGGHSLHAALLQQKLERALGTTLTLTTLFEFPTVAGLAKHLRGGVTGVDPAVARAAERMRRRREARR